MPAFTSACTEFIPAQANPSTQETNSEGLLFMSKTKKDGNISQNEMGGGGVFFFQRLKGKGIYTTEPISQCNDLKKVNFHSPTINLKLPTKMTGYKSLKKETNSSCL